MIIIINKYTQNFAKPSTQQLLLSSGISDTKDLKELYECLKKFLAQFLIELKKNGDLKLKTILYSLSLIFFLGCLAILCIYVGWSVSTPEFLHMIEKVDPSKMPWYKDNIGFSHVAEGVKGSQYTGFTLSALIKVVIPLAVQAYIYTRNQE